MPIEVREISGLIAVVSIALIGTTIYVIGVAWRGMTNTYFRLTEVERRQVGRMTWWTTLCVIIVLSVATLVGIYIPQLTPWAVILVIVLMEIVVGLVRLISWSVRKIRRIEKEELGNKIDEISLSYFLSFSFLSWSIFFNLFALLGIGTTMLDIRIGPYWLDNYNWGRWALVDSIFLFIAGLPILGYASLKSNWQRELRSNHEG